MNAAKLPTSETLLGSRTVADAMHHGIVTCSPRAGLHDGLMQAELSRLSADRRFPVIG